MRLLHYFDIDDELFADVKENFNRGINQIVDGMNKKNVCEGELTIGVKISLAKLPVINADGEEEMITVPTISHKVAAKMSVKNEAKGKIKPSTEGGWLRLTEMNGRYVVVTTPEDASQLAFEEMKDA